MEELVAAIRAAIDDAELAATQCVEKNWRVDGANSCQVYVRREDYSTRTIAWCGNGYEDDFSNVIHIAHNDPARVLRRVAADRKILEMHSPTGWGGPLCITCAEPGPGFTTIGVNWPCPTVLALAEGYDIDVSTKEKEKL